MHELLQGLHGLIQAEADFRPETSERIFRIAASDLAHIYVLPRLMPRLRKAAPGLAVDATALSVDGLSERMERGEIDFTIASADNTPLGFPSRKMREYEFRCLYRQGHPLVGPDLSAEALCEMDHLAVTITSGRLFADLDESLRQKGLKRKIVCSVPNFLLVPEIVRNSDLVAIVPSNMAETERSGLSAQPIAVDVPPVAIHISWHPRFKRDAAHKWMRDMIVDAVHA
ncbi:MAG: hypothetical protein Tsb0019_10320 [Roseibium sp.]